MAGILNHTIADFIEKKLVMMLKNFVGNFPLNYITRFITFHSMMTEMGALYPFIFINTDCSDKKGTLWWSFLDLNPKKEIFYLTVLVLKVSKNFYCKMMEKH